LRSSAVGLRLASLAGGFKSHRDLSPTPCLTAGRLRSSAAGLRLASLAGVQIPPRPLSNALPHGRAFAFVRGGIAARFARVGSNPTAAFRTTPLQAGVEPRRLPRAHRRRSDASEALRVVAQPRMAVQQEALPAGVSSKVSGWRAGTSRRFHSNRKVAG